MQAVFTFLITLQFVAVVAHDLVDIPGWTHGKQVQAVVARRKLWVATAINAVFPGLAVGFAFRLRGERTVNVWRRLTNGFGKVRSL